MSTTVPASWLNILEHALVRRTKTYKVMYGKNHDLYRGAHAALLDFAVVRAELEKSDATLKP